jgi:uncharacterized membrane protein YqjE
MSTPPPATEGFVGTLRALGESLVSALHSRVELISLELQQEKFRLVQTFIWISTAVFTAAMAVTFACLTLVYFCRENARLATLGGLAIFFTFSLVAIILTFRRFIASQPRPFDDTLDELEKDRACIREAN